MFTATVAIGNPGQLYFHDSCLTFFYQISPTALYLLLECLVYALLLSNYIIHEWLIGAFDS